jgi:hypothetical protein
VPEPGPEYLRFFAPPPPGLQICFLELRRQPRGLSSTGPCAGVTNRSPSPHPTPPQSCSSLRHGCNTKSRRSSPTCRLAAVVKTCKAWQQRTQPQTQTTQYFESKNLACGCKLHIGCIHVSRKSHQLTRWKQHGSATAPCSRPFGQDYSLLRQEPLMPKVLWLTSAARTATSGKASSCLCDPTLENVYNR